MPPRKGFARDPVEGIKPIVRKGGSSVKDECENKYYVREDMLKMLRKFRVTNFEQYSFIRKLS